MQPPFAAPPIDGDRTRVWIGLGVGAAALLLCCLGGVAGIGGLVVVGFQAVNEQARATVGDYLDALTAEDYVKAYALLCDDVQREESVQEFTDRISAGPRVTGYTLGEADVREVVVLPVEVRYADGRQRAEQFRLVNDGDTGELEVCGVE